MAAVHLCMLPGVARTAAAPSTVTISAIVQDPDANPRARTVYLYPENNLLAAVGVATSNPSTGAVSFTLAGHASMRWTMAVQGEAGENCVIHTKLPVD